MYGKIIWVSISFIEHESARIYLFKMGYESLREIVHPNMICLFFFFFNSPTLTHTLPHTHTHILSLSLLFSFLFFLSFSFFLFLSRLLSPSFFLVIKVLIVGNGAVGKSSMIQRYCKGIFTNEYKKTIGVDFLEKKIK